MKALRVAVVLGLSVLAALQPVMGSGEEPEPTEVHAGPVCLPPRELVKLPRGSVVDSKWDMFRPHWRIARITNRRNSWAVVREWYQLLEEPGRCYSFAELDSLAREGVIEGDTRLAIVRYKFLVRAGSAEEAQRKALEMDPPLGRKQLEREFRRVHEEERAQGAHGGNSSRAGR